MTIPTGAFPHATSPEAARAGTLLPSGTPYRGSYAVGRFRIVWDDAGVRAIHGSEPARGVWSAPPGRAFVAAAVGRFTATGRAGHLTPHEDVLARYPHQSVEDVRTVPVASGSDEEVVVVGRLWRRPEPSGDLAIAYRVIFRAVDGETLEIAVELDPTNVLDHFATSDADEAHDDHREDHRDDPLDVRDDELRGARNVRGHAGANVRVFTELFWQQDPHAQVFGFGVQFTHLDLRGRCLPILTAEQGVGRGAQPLTKFADALGGAGGHWWSTYAPVPAFLGTDLRGTYLTDTAPSRFDFRRPGVASARVVDATLHARAVAAASPAAFIEALTRHTGRMAPLPAWVQDGGVVGMQGGAEKAERVVAALQDRGAQIAAVWLQDWVGNRRVPFGKRLWWDWRLDRTRYPEWEAMVARLAARGVRVMTYVNPFLGDASHRDGAPGLFAEADAAGYFVKRADGSTYKTDQGDFVAGLIDLSDERARAWYLDTLSRSLATSGTDGWMADFGEGLPFDAVLSGGDAHAWHNHYPEAWAEFTAELRERVAELRGVPASEIVTFFRSGYTRSPGHAGLFWLGDQTVTWDRFDGLRSALTGMLSSGFSGFALQHGDVGGYTSTMPPLPRLTRSKELLARWGELMAFTAVLRTHEGNRPEENAQVYDDDETMAAFARATRLHAAWRDLRGRLMDEAAATGIPVVRHAWLAYPNDPATTTVHEQFFLGPDVLVAPVLEEGADFVRAYLPAASGRWRHVFEGGEFDAGEHGRWVGVTAPLGRPGVFVRPGTPGVAGLEAVRTARRP